MPSSSRPALPRRPSYFALSRAPRYSVLFALPLLVAYESLAAILARPGRGELRNGADVMLRTAFTAVAGQRGPTVFMAVMILVGVFFVARDLRSNKGGLRAIVFGGMLLESTVLAGAFGLVIGLATARLLGSLHVLMIAQGGIRGMPLSTRLMLSLGAGLYEELFFRVLLVGGLAFAGRTLLGLGTRAAGVIAVIIGAIVFSAFHYIGPFGDPFELQSFTFRMLSGLAFSGLYLLRGFGVTAWTHALYDSFLLVL
ncbi:MAG: CPBP family intramembrane glutamic endopeptidase [Gemmatimonadaceae bacterium]